MGRPYYHKALPVALYDPILAELTYKLRHLDAPEKEAAELFPNAAQFLDASKTFCKKATYHYVTEKDRCDIIFGWIKAVFSTKCVQQVRDGVAPMAGEPLICDEEVVGGVLTKAEKVSLLNILYKCKNEPGLRRCSHAMRESVCTAPPCFGSASPSLYL